MNCAFCRGCILVSKIDEEIAISIVDSTTTQDKRLCSVVSCIRLFRSEKSQMNGSELIIVNRGKMAPMRNVRFVKLRPSSQ